MKEERLERKGVDGECMRKGGRLHKCTDKDKMYLMKYKGEGRRVLSILGGVVDNYIAN